MKNLGLGIQELSKFKNNNLIYVDKTKIIHKLVTTGGYYFLSRPRRFGKSLLVNTIAELFSGNKELFENTWIFDKWNFEDKYPVIKISFDSLAYRELGLKAVLEKELDKIAEQNNIVFKKAEVYSEKFKELIEELGKEKPVVILIDEYDKPIIDYIEKDKRSEGLKNRAVLKEFYSVIKNLDGYIKFFFVTGVSKFSKVSIFSELNNLTDITVDKNYSTLTGYIEKEIIDNYSEYLKEIEKGFSISRETLLKIMKSWYDGYSWDGDNFVYNPFSILTFFQKKEFSNYWFKSGTPTFLTKMIREMAVDIDRYESSFIISDSILDSYELDNIDLDVLLFQTGYLTIKEKIRDLEDFSLSYKLAYPNKEVQNSFYDYLIGEFTGIAKTQFFEIIKNFQTTLENNDIERFILSLKSLYSEIPSNIFIKERESYYHTVIYLILKLMKADIIKVEKQTNRGRIDAVVFTKKYIFVMEFKMKSANEALKQIKDKKYYEPYLSDEREVFCLGVAFDKKERNIGEYKIKTVDELLK